MTRLQELLKALPPIDFDLPGTPTTFHPFDRLPTELKNKIWGYAVAEPRFIQLYEVMYDDHSLAKNPQLKNQRANPPVLHINRQAREEGLRYYTPCLEFNPNILVEKERGIPSERKYVYINFVVDTILFERMAKRMFRRHWRISTYFDRNISLAGFNLFPETLKRCQRIAFTYEMIHCNPSYLVLLKNILEQDSMEEITILAHKFEARLHGRYLGVLPPLYRDWDRVDFETHIRAQLDAGRNGLKLRIRWDVCENMKYGYEQRADNLYLFGPSTIW